MTGPDVADGRCWRDVRGEGPDVVLVHGTMDRSSSFGRLARALEGWRVTRYDRRGYGHSTPLGPPERFSQQVTDLLEVLGPEPTMVFGHSYGGTVALAAAVRAPERFRGLVVYECPLPWLPWWPRASAGAAAVASHRDPEEAAEAFMRRVVGDQRWERLPPSTREARRAEGVTLVAEVGQLRTPGAVPVDLAEVTVPVVASHGTRGAKHHARAAAEVAAVVPGAELRVVDGADHGVHLGHPHEAAGLIEDLAARIGGSQAT